MRPSWPRRLLTGLLPLLGLLPLAAALGGCGEEVVAWSTLDLLLTADPTDPPVTRLQIALRNTTDGAPYAAPAQAGDAQFAPALPKDWSLASKPWRMRIQQPATAQTKLAIRIAGVDNAGTLRAVYSGVIDTRKRGEQAVRLLAVGSQPQCDADADGVPACKAGCLPDPVAQCDCNDDATLGSNGKPKGALASPFFAEDACLQCGDGLDQNCDGSDVACVDADGDKVADCQENACPPGGDNDPTIYPGAVERCNGVDDDCDGTVDDGLPYTDLLGNAATANKGDSCGAGFGRCEGGTVVCSPDGTALVCSTASQKAAEEDCSNAMDDDCDGNVNNGCASQDLDGDGVPNSDEDAASCPLFPQAALYAEYYPGAPEGCCPAGKTAAACDLNCDGQTTPCPANDQDGDGIPTPADCNDADPAVYPGAPQQCGDGKTPCPVDSDPPCSNDKDGDKFNADMDCNDSDALVYPGAPERCNGQDDDCDGKKDEGNPEAGSASCGDPDGECGKVPGVLVCKHYPQGAKPDPLDCGTRGYEPQSATCIGCQGDARAKTDSCNGLDDDCDGSSDEDFAYTDASGQAQPMFAACDGIGACGVGVVECATSGTTRCSTDPGGSAAQNKPEVCNNQDDSCNGLTDEDLTSLADAQCQKVGVCSAGQTSAVCKAGVWFCDYSKVLDVEFSAGTSCDPASGPCHCPAGSGSCVSLQEQHCDGKDNDCDGLTDDDFVLGNLSIGDACGTGACSGGAVVCTADTTGLVCASDGLASPELCNLQDDDCDGQIDEWADLTVAQSPCLLVGVCTPANVVATCNDGQWSCSYTAVDGYQDASETTCDGLDNDCDGQTDEDFGLTDWNGQTRVLGAACGTGVCGGGKAVCAADGTGLVCSTADLAGASPEYSCNGEDDDCDGQTDEDFTYTDATGKELAIGSACDGWGACGMGVVECHDNTAMAVCSTNANGSASEAQPEQCNDVDDDCDGLTDEGCNTDGDGYCSAGMVTVGTPAVCALGGGDCNDADELVFPGAAEACDGVDNDCSGTTDSEFVAADGVAAELPVGATCGVGSCAGGLVACDADGAGASCTTTPLATTETCNNQDDDCDGTTDEGCDDDGDGFCDASMGWSAGAAACPNTVTASALDCNDVSDNVFPGQVELCDGVDNGCRGATDAGCDDDADGFCDAAMERVGEPSICPLGGADCDDEAAAISPAATEVCDNLDNDCDAGPDNGCDSDGDGFCDSAMLVEQAAALCPTSPPGPGNDCNDADNQVFPGQTESCNGVDDNCSATTDEADATGCSVYYLDADRDSWGSASSLCLCSPEGYHDATQTGDCADDLDKVHPGQAENCATAADDDCNQSNNEQDALGCVWFAKDGDGDGYAPHTANQQCWCVADSAGGYAVPLPLAATDCDDTASKVFPGQPEVCGDGVDNNCVAGTDESCGP